jgi:UDP-glucuronate 4-epimerase
MNEITLVTGSAGFIGFHASLKLLSENKKVIGIDNINSYYDQKIKIKRLKILKKNKNFLFFKGDLSKDFIYNKIRNFLNKIQIIYHFAGQAGVRYSIKNPEDYVKNNILAYIKLLEFFKFSNSVKLFIYASSSSVYGDNKSESYSKSSLLRPLSIYSASKISMELISNVYCNLYKKKFLGLRFFTVYGPWGRPDMSYYKFCNLLSANKPIEIYNYGNHSRSFTYIDDLVLNLFKIKDYVFKKKKNISADVYNLGNPKPTKLITFIKTLEKITGRTFKKKFIKKQLGDVKTTKANLNVENKLFKLKFNYTLASGLEKFYKWYIQKNKF